MQECILRDFLAKEETTNHQLLISKTNLRWFSDHRSKIILSSASDVDTVEGHPNPTSEEDTVESHSNQFFHDILEFERVLCRCGLLGHDMDRPYSTISYPRHVTFCNTSYLNLTIEDVQENSLPFMQSAFKCLKTLIELQVRCADDNINAPSLVASWTSVVPSLKAIRFGSVGSSVSNKHIISYILTYFHKPGEH
jgi:hypothetical protein